MELQSNWVTLQWQCRARDRFCKGDDIDAIALAALS